MSEEKKHYIRVGKQLFTVSKRLYLYYYRSRRRIKYYEHDIKIDSPVCDGNGEIIGYKLSKETSLDQIVGKPPDDPDTDDGPEDIAIHRLMVEKLRECLLLLDEDERRLIVELFYKRKSERALSLETGIPSMTIHCRKVKILGKLKKMIEK